MVRDPAGDALPLRDARRGPRALELCEEGLRVRGAGEARIAPRGAARREIAGEAVEGDLLLRLDLLRETDLTRQRDLLPKMSLFERLRLLEQLKRLELETEAATQRKGDAR